MTQRNQNDNQKFADGWGHRHLTLKECRLQQVKLYKGYSHCTLNEIKMKKYFISLLTMVLAITVSIVSCTKQDAEKQLKDQNLLNEDETFIAMVNETHDYLKFLASGIRANSLKRDEVNNNLSNLQSKNLSFDEQMREIDGIFKTSVSGRLKSHMIATQQSMQKLESNYGKIDAATMNREVEKVMATMAPKTDDNNTITLAAADCGWRYYGCSATATAGAILCHAGCDTTALATTAGLGIPACVLACGTLQAWAIVECADKFCD